MRATDDSREQRAEAKAQTAPRDEEGSKHTVTEAEADHSNASDSTEQAEPAPADEGEAETGKAAPAAPESTRSGQAPSEQAPSGQATSEQKGSGRQDASRDSGDAPLATPAEVAIDENLVRAIEEGTLDERTAIASAIAAAADEEAYRQEIAREGLGNGPSKSAPVPALQSPLRVNELKPGTATIQHLYPRPLAETIVAGLRKAFRIILQLGLILAICLAGEQISEVLPFDFPSNICSMLLLLLFLVTGVLKMDNISEAADFLLDNMAIFFIPAAVAIMGSVDLLAGNILKLVIICLITTVLVFFVTSYTVSGVAKLMAHIESKRASAGAGAGAAQGTVAAQGAGTVAGSDAKER